MDVFALVFLSKITLISFENAPILILIGLIAHASLAPFFALVVPISKRFNNWKCDLSILLLLGTIRGFILITTGKVFDLPAVVSDEFRVFNSLIAFPTWFIFFTFTLEAKHQYQREFDLLFHYAVKDHMVANLQKEVPNRRVLSAEETFKRVQSLTSKLGEEIQQALLRPNTEADFTHESNRIQDLVQMELRPTSRELWQGKFISAPQILKYDLLRIVLFNQKLPIAIVLLSSGPFLFVGLTGAYGIQIAIIQTLLATLPVYLAYRSIEVLGQVKKLSTSQRNALILTSSFLLPIILQYFLIPSDLKLATEFTYFVLFQFALWFVLVTLLIGHNLYYSLVKQRQAVLSSFKSLLRDDRYLELINRKSVSLDNLVISRYLHGEIQTGLTAAILLLQQASKDGDVDLARETLENAVKILMRNHSEALIQSVQPREVQLAQIASGWSGIADVTINLHSIDLLDEFTARNAIELIGEGVANAIRHGKATKVSVSDKSNFAEVQFNISSNGKESPQGKSGLGTEMFNRLAKNWKFEMLNGSGFLSFTVPTSQREICWTYYERLRT